MSQNQINLVVAPGFNHTAIAVDITSSATKFSYAATSATSDSSWVNPSINLGSKQLVLNFNSSSLTNSSYTATITLTNESDVQTIYVSAAITPLNISNLIADPFRSRVYGVHQNGINAGSVIIYDPNTSQSLGCITVGKKPSGLAVSNDGSELYVLNSADPSIHVVDLVNLRVKEIIALTAYTNWGSGDTFGNIGTGPGSILYYTDGAWAPALRVFDRNSQQVLQTITGDTSGFGVGGFALSHDKTVFMTWAQYGWSAGSAASYISKYSVSPTGLLTFVQSTSQVYSASFGRDPLGVPVLCSYDDTRFFLKQWAVNPANINAVVQNYPTPVYSITPNGEVAVTASSIIQKDTGTKLYNLPFTTSVQAVTPDYSKLVLFNSTARVLQTVDLIGTLGSNALGLTITPANGTITLSPSKLQWSPIAGVNTYQVYLATSAAELNNATPASSCYLGQTNTPSFSLSQTLTPGVTYYWRIDSVRTPGVTTGAVCSFTVSTIASTVSKIEAATVQGHTNYQVTVGLSSTASDSANTWQAAADQPWVTFQQTTGTAPGNLTVILNAGSLSPGTYTATISMKSGSTPAFSLPVKLKVEPLKLTVIKAHPQTNRLFAISEDTATSGAAAYLLELDSDQESILRVVPVGNSATDLAIHVPEGRIYVTNWSTGYLLAIDINTFEQVRTYAFSPYPGTTYGGDVYRISAGAAGRLVCEEYDQWIEASIYNTTTATVLGKAYVRQGGGGFAPGGRYYYHGDDNSSGAEIHKYDVTGDVMTELAHTRVQSYSYYGSRTVVVSGSGNGVFWNGSYFDSNLTEQWSMGVEIYSCTPDSKYAMGENSIYDTQLKQEVLGMPTPTRVSAYNGTSGKLVVQAGGKIGFYSLGSPLSLPAPVLTTGSVSSSTADFTWTDRSLETGFTVQKRIVGSATWDNAVLAAKNTTAATVSSLQPNTSYEFRIQANATNVSSDWSNTVKATTLAGPPSAPTLNPPTYTAGSVSLTWTDSDTEDGYVLERSPAYSYVWSVIATPGQNVLSFKDTTTTKATCYAYRIKAVRGTFASPYSQIQIVTTPLAPPSAPPFILASPISSSEIAIYWATVSGATSYIVERYSSSMGWVAIATTGALENYYTDAGLPADSWNQYHIRAVNTGGQSVPSLTAYVRTYAQMESWRLKCFGSESSQGQAATDYVGPDGVTNLMKFACNLAPDESYPLGAQSSNKGTPVVSVDPSTQRIKVDFIRRKSSSNPGIQYIVEYSSDLVNWQASGSETSVVSIDSECERVTCQDNISTSAVPQRFARVRVVAQP